MRAQKAGAAVPIRSHWKPFKGERSRHQPTPIRYWRQAYLLQPEGATVRPQKLLKRSDTIQPPDPNVHRPPQIRWRFEREHHAIPDSFANSLYERPLAASLSCHRRE